jgi:hypothetical protein
MTTTRVRKRKAKKRKAKKKAAKKKAARKAKSNRFFLFPSKTPAVSAGVFFIHRPVSSPRDTPKEQSLKTGTTPEPHTISPVISRKSQQSLKDLFSLWRGWQGKV